MKNTLLLTGREEFIELEKLVYEDVNEYGRAKIKEMYQQQADTIEMRDSRGGKFTRIERKVVQITTHYGVIEVNVRTGRSGITGEWETPFIDTYLSGHKHKGCVSPNLEDKIIESFVHTGAYATTEKICTIWSTPVSDDKIRDIVIKTGMRCCDENLPERCEKSAKSEDTLIIMMDGWFARHRGEDWGMKKKSQSHIEWKEIKSAVMYVLRDNVNVSKNRCEIISKHILAMPANTEPYVFGQTVEKESIRVGLKEAKEVYFIMDGGTYLWNIYHDRFSNIAKGSLDYYHACQHLNTLAEHLFPDNLEQKENWYKLRRSKLKYYGAKRLIEILSEIEENSDNLDDKAKTEIAYFNKHEQHMNYHTLRKENIPIGSGKVESLCAQYQDKFKRRGQFWTQEGFEYAMKVYNWCVNGELKYAFRSREAVA